MSFKRFEVTLKGITPLMHHRMSEAALFALLGDKGKKKKTKEVKTPREIAEEHAYKSDDGSFYIPTSYICGAFSHVSSDYKQTNSQRKSYKAIAGGVFRPESETATLIDDKGKPIRKYEVDIRKATNHQKGAIAVCRPRFDKWSTKFTIEINSDLLTPETAQEILQDAGRRAGIGSFRVAKSGYFGQFIVECFHPIKD